MSKLKLLAWRVASWTNWYFKEVVANDLGGAPLTRFQETLIAAVLLPFFVVFAPIWLPCVGIGWPFNTFCAFGAGSPPDPKVR